MKLCEKCQVEMLEASFYGYPRFIDMDHEIDKFELHIYTGKQNSFLGIKYPDFIRVPLKTAVCPKCGKVENYIDPSVLTEE